MRIAIDARPALDPRRTGVGEYTRKILRHLPAADPLPEYVAWYLHAKGLLRRRHFFDGWAPNLAEHATRIPARAFQPVSWRLGVPRLEWLGVDVDAFLATNFLPPPTRGRGVVLIVHDLAYERFPATAPQMDARWRRVFRRWLRRAGGVIVPSRSAERDLLEHHDVDPSRVHVVPHGVDPFVRPERAEVDRVRERLGVGGRYALFVGGIEPRKNLRGLVEAFARARTDAWLVVAGGRTNWIPEEAGRLERAVAALPSDVRARVVLAGYVSERDKRALLAGAEALAYPSLYEGYLRGLVEAFARARTDAWLVVAGGRTNWIPEEAGRLDRAVAALPPEVRTRVVLTGYVSERDKRALLAGAEALAYPSLYEGFGFPVLEAFAAGVPVVTSNASSLPEVAGDAALLVDPRDPAAIAAGLERLLGDDGLREGLRRAGLERARAFPWTETAAKTAEVLRAAAGV